MPQLNDGQAILVVRLGGVGRSEQPPPKEWCFLWDSHRDCAGLLEAFIECENPPRFSITYGVSANQSTDSGVRRFDTANPYGFEPQNNGFLPPA